MNIKRKLEIAELNVKSIAEHRDDDSAVRIAALNKIKAQCDAAIEGVQAEVAADVEASV